jgi:lipopolysaccharide biosynthesis regulator YciM
VGEITALQLLQVSADQQERPERALQAAKELVQAAGRLGDREAMAASHFSLATRYATTGNLVEAEAGFQQALSLQRALGLHHEAAVATGMVGQIQVARGEREKGVHLLKVSLMELESLGSEAAETVREVLTELGE